MQDPDAALLDGDFIPSTAASTVDLINYAASKAQGNDELDKSDSVRVDSSSFKFLGH